MVHHTGVPPSCRRRPVSKAALGPGLRQDDGRADVSYNRAFIALAVTGTGVLEPYHWTCTMRAFGVNRKRLVKHAGAVALEALSDLLESLRMRVLLVERRPRIFYLKGKAFLHFHEDRAGLFADVRDGGDWHRLPADSAGERAEILALVDRSTGRG